MMLLICFMHGNAGMWGLRIGIVLREPDTLKAYLASTASSVAMVYSLLKQQDLYFL